MKKTLALLSEAQNNDPLAKLLGELRSLIAHSPAGSVEFHRSLRYRLDNAIEDGLSYEELEDKVIPYLQSALKRVEMDRLGVMRPDVEAYLEAPNDPYLVGRVWAQLPSFYASDSKPLEIKDKTALERLLSLRFGSVPKIYNYTFRLPNKLQSQLKSKRFVDWMNGLDAKELSLDFRFDNTSLESVLLTMDSMLSIGKKNVLLSFQNITPPSAEEFAHLEDDLIDLCKRMSGRLGALHLSTGHWSVTFPWSDQAKLRAHLETAWPFAEVHEIVLRLANEGF